MCNVPIDAKCTSVIMYFFFLVSSYIYIYISLYIYALYCCCFKQHCVTMKSSVNSHERREVTDTCSSADVPSIITACSSPSSPSTHSWFLEGGLSDFYQQSDTVLPSLHPFFSLLRLTFSIFSFVVRLLPPNHIAIAIFCTDTQHEP